MIEVRRNTEKDGIEISFSIKPSTAVLEWLKSHHFRWSQYSKAWYKKYDEYNYNLAKEYIASLSPEDDSNDELSIGIKIEMEHTNDPAQAKKIAMDHLKENPKYYSDPKSKNWAVKELKKEAMAKEYKGITSDEFIYLDITYTFKSEFRNKYFKLYIWPNNEIESQGLNQKKTEIKNSLLSKKLITKSGAITEKGKKLVKEIGKGVQYFISGYSDLIGRHWSESEANVINSGELVNKGWYFPETDVLGSGIFTAEEWNKLPQQGKSDKTITRSVKGPDGNNFNVDYNLAPFLERIWAMGYKTGQSDSGTKSDHPGRRYVSGEKVGEIIPGGAYLTFWKPEATAVKEAGRDINTLDQVEKIREAATKAGFSVEDSQTFVQPSLVIRQPETKSGLFYHRDFVETENKRTNEKYPGLHDSNFKEWLEKRDNEISPEVIKELNFYPDLTDNDVIELWERFVSNLEAISKKTNIPDTEYFTFENAPDNIKDRFDVSKNKDRAVIEAVPKTFKNTLPDGEKVYSVDGKYVRDNIYSDFSQGGNDMAYPEFVPIGELWYEEAMEAEKEHILRHEKRERDLMVNAWFTEEKPTQALTYAEAHEVAKKLEDKERGIRLIATDILTPISTTDEKITFLKQVKFIESGEKKIDKDYAPEDSAYKQSLIYIPVFRNLWYYADNTDPDSETFDNIDDAIKDLSQKGRGEPDKYFKPVKELRLYFQLAWIDSNGKIFEKEDIFPYEDLMQEPDSESKKFIEQFGEDSLIDYAEFDTREESAENLLNEVYFGIEKDLIKEYEEDGVKLNISVQETGKYRNIYVKNEQGDEVGRIKLRIADHSYNPANNDSDAQSGNFISIEIANKNETEDRFHGKYGIQFTGEDNYSDVIDVINERVKEIIDTWNIKIEETKYLFKKGDNVVFKEQYRDKGDTFTYELIEDPDGLRVKVKPINSKMNIPPVYVVNINEIERAPEKPKPDILNTFLPKLKIVMPFLGQHQIDYLTRLYRSEERQGAQDIVDELAAIIESIPKPHETEDIKTSDKTVHLHYFQGDSDWYIVEKDKGGPDDEKPSQQTQAFGYAILGGDMINAEWGYIDIESLKEMNVELDFHFEPVKFSELKKKWEPEEVISPAEVIRLPIIDYAGEKYFVDFKLRQLRNVKTAVSFDFTTIKDEDLKAKLRRLRAEAGPNVHIEGLDDTETVPKTEEIVPETEVSVTVSDYSNEFELNKAIEKLLDNRWNDKASDWSADQLQFISNYSGYGGLDDLAMKAGDKLDKKSLFEYFTPETVIEKMWGLAYKYGYKDGLVLEPSCGTGPFFDRRFVSNTVPKHGYEINKYSAKIAKLLYPEAIINEGKEVMSFEELFIINNYTVRSKVTARYSLVIGNPPYGSFAGIYAGMGEKSFTHASNYIDYFILRGLDLLVKDALLIYIIGAETAAGGTPFLDQGMNKAKEMISERGKLIDAYRLPSGVFSRTDVTSDIVVFRKR